MKPINLTIKGINNIKEEQNIDFSLLLSSGIFGIFGPTGSGKSTILDSIIIALYGTGSIPRGSRSFINSDMNKGFIKFSFDINISGQNKIVNIERSFKTNKTTNGALSDKVRLSIEYQGTTEEILDRVQDVDQKIIDIIGLRAEDFVKSVVLPQGKFSEFLRLTGKNRRDMLERIFNLEKYGSKLQDKIKTIRRNLDKDIEVVNGKLGLLGDKTAKGLSEIESSRKNIQKEIKNKKTEINQLEKNIVLIGKRDNIREELVDLEVIVKNYEDNKDYWDEIKDNLELTKKSQPILKIKKDIEQSSNHLDTLVISEKNLREKHRSMKSRISDMDIKQEKIYKEKKEILPEKKILQSKLKLINDLKYNLDENKGKLKLKKSESEIIEGNIDKVKSELSDISIVKEEKDKKKNDVLKEITENIVDIHYREKLKDFVDKLKNKENISGEINKLKLELSNHDSSIEDNIEKTEKNKTKIDEMLIIIKNLKEKENHLKNQIQSISLEISMEKSLSQNVVDVQNKLIDLSKEYEMIKETIDTLKKDKSAFHSSLDVTIDAFDINILGMAIREKLNDGDVCPVCMGTYNHLGLLEIREGSFDSDVLDIVQSREKLISIDFQLSHSEKEAERFEEEIKDLNDKKIKLQLEISQIDEKKYIQDNLKVDLLKMENEIQSLENKLRENENMNLLLSSDNKSLRESLEKDKAKLYTKEEESIKIEKEIEKLSIIEKNPEEKLKIILENEKKNKELIDIRNIVEKELENISIRYNEENIKLVSLKRDKDNISKIIRDLSISINETSDKIGINYLDSDTKGQCEQLLAYITEFEENEIIVQEELTSLKKEFAHVDKKYHEITEGIKNYSEIISSKKIESKELIENLGLPVNYMDKIYEGSEYESLNSKYYMNLEKYSSGKKKYQEQIAKLKDYEHIRESIVEVTSKKDEILEVYNELLKNLGNLDILVDEYKEKLEIFKKLENEKSLIEKSIVDYGIINSLIKGNKLVDFIAKGEMEYILRDATSRLMKLTGNRYSLGLDMNGNFVVNDYYNSGISRNINTLSGGESFLTSLSMALALSSKIQMKSKSNIDFFFLDEGFGTLDRDTLETVLSSLEKLKMEQLSVGIISHVEEIRHRINSKIVLENKEGSTDIKMIVG